MRAVRIPTTGPVDVIDLAEPTDDDTQAFLADLYSVIGCNSVECVRLNDDIDAWLDETGLVDGKPLNQQATLLAHSYAGGVDLPGIVVIVGADPSSGQSITLTDDQVDTIVDRVSAYTSAAPRVTRT